MRRDTLAVTWQASQVALAAYARAVQAHHTDECQNRRIRCRHDRSRDGLPWHCLIGPVEDSKLPFVQSLFDRPQDVVRAALACEQALNRFNAEQLEQADLRDEPVEMFALRPGRETEAFLAAPE